MSREHDNNLAESMCGLTMAVAGLARTIENSNNNQAVLQGMAELKRIILMTQTELAKALDNQNTQIGKIAKEQSDRFDALTKTIEDLNAVITAGGDVTPEVTTALANTQSALDNLDAAIPDAPATPA